MFDFNSSTNSFISSSFNVLIFLKSKNVIIGRILCDCVVFFSQRWWEDLSSFIRFRFLHFIFSTITRVDWKAFFRLTLNFSYSKSHCSKVSEKSLFSKSPNFVLRFAQKTSYGNSSLAPADYKNLCASENTSKKTRFFAEISYSFACNCLFWDKQAVQTTKRS